MTFTPGAGTVFQINFSGSLVTIGQVKGVTPPSAEVGTVETTHLTSLAREFLATILDGGEATLHIEFDFTDSNHIAVWTAFKAKVARPMNIIFNDAGDATCAFDAIITKFPFDEIDVESVVTVPVTVKVTGDITLTP